MIIYIIYDYIIREELYDMSNEKYSDIVWKETLWAQMGDYYYRYSALGPVWAETRVQSGYWYGSGTLHPGQVRRGCLPLLSPAF